MYSYKQNLTTASAQYVALVGKVAEVIDTLRHESHGLTLHQIAARTGYVKSTAHRILHSLMRHGYIEQDGPGRVYRLGLQFVLVARNIRKCSVLQLARPYLEKLAASFNETVYLALLQGDRAVFVDVEETRRDLCLVGPLSAEVHFHATAAGKAIAAYLPPDARARLLRRMPPRITEHTRVQRDEIEREWSCVRRLGFALNDEETIPGAVFVAAPIFDTCAAVCGSLAVGIPKSRYSESLKTRLASELLENCRQLSDKLAAGLVSRIGTGRQNLGA